MKTKCSYNIIGDIHGRSCWRTLVREDCINIFVGDYFDPYEYVSQVERVANFQEILDYKRQHPGTILLYGNHDLHYLISSEHYSRYEPRYANDYWRTFVQSESLFYGVAYPIIGHACRCHQRMVREIFRSLSIGIFN